MSKTPKPASVSELISVVKEYRELQALCLANAKFLAGADGQPKPNPLLDELYFAAVAAAKSLQPLVAVEFKSVSVLSPP